MRPLLGGSGRPAPYLLSWSRKYMPHVSVRPDSTTRRPAGYRMVTRRPPRNDRAVSPPCSRRVRRRHDVLEVQLHAVGQRELRHRAAGAGALEAYLDDPVLHVDELDVATVGLQGRTDVAESLLDLLLEFSHLLSPPRRLRAAACARRSSPWIG